MNFYITLTRILISVSASDCVYCNKFRLIKGFCQSIDDLCSQPINLLLKTHSQWNFRLKCSGVKFFDLALVCSQAKNKFVANGGGFDEDFMA